MTNEGANKMKCYTIELEPGVWLAETGDLGRTIKRNNAKIFFTKKDAIEGLKSAKSFRQFENARIRSIW